MTPTYLERARALVNTWCETPMASSDFEEGEALAAKINEALTQVRAEALEEAAATCEAAEREYMASAKALRAEG